jgi:hypothetical protein
VDLPSIEGKWEPGPGLLQQIEPIPGSMANDGTTILCKIGTATTNEQFHKWYLSNQVDGNNWTIPLSVIMVEITFGSSITPLLSRRWHSS